MIDQAIGFAMASVVDPVSQTQVPITGNLIYYMMGVLFIRTGGLNSVIGAFLEAYKTIPIGGANFAFDQGLMQLLVELTSEYFSVGIRIAAPILGTVFIINVALGLLVKASPQMNIFVVGMPIKLLCGLVLLYIISPYLLQVYEGVFLLMFNAIGAIINGLSG